MSRGVSGVPSVHPGFRVAVREGFEPSVELLRPYNGLANRRFRPLSHLTA